MTGLDWVWLSLIGVTTMAWWIVRGHLVPRRYHEELDHKHDQMTRVLRELQERNHYLTSLVAQVGSGHQRSTMRWTRGAGWTENAMALTQPASPPPCRHERTVDVESALDPEVVLARLCLGCNEQLEPLPEGTQVIVAGDANLPVLMTDTEGDWDVAIFE